MKSDQTKLRDFAHDMRNALTSMYGYAQVLELSLAKKGLEKELLIAKSITKSVKKMSDEIVKHEIGKKRNTVRD